MSKDKDAARRRARLDAALAALIAAQPVSAPEAADPPAAAIDDPRIAALADLMRCLRPSQARDTAAAAKNVDVLMQKLAEQAPACEALRASALWLLAELNAVHLYTDSGVLANEGFFTSFFNRLWHKLLPEERRGDRLKDVVGVIFSEPDDHVWVGALPDEIWHSLLAVLKWPELRGSKPAEEALLQVLDALEVISYRITAIGLEPEIVHIYPAIERYESPFLMQNVEMRQLFDERQKAVEAMTETRFDYAHLLVLLEQCQDMIGRIRRQAEKSGASIGLTALLVRLRQNIRRMHHLLALFDPASERARYEAGLRLLREVVAGDNRKNSLRDLAGLNMELLAQQITSHAGRAGEAYITTTRSEYFALLRSAMGAGLLVAIVAAAKLWLGREPHAPFVQAVLYSLNYIIGFVLMYMLHFSLATKQPAMTASRIAHSMDVKEKGRDRLAGLEELVVRTLRSQFIAVLGNIIVAVPVALLIGYWLSLPDQPYPSTGKAEDLLREVDPLRALTWLHGALTGIALFLTGLISGYYDNKALYSRIPQRLAQRVWLRRLLGSRGRAALAAYVGDHLGGIAGSIAFGVMLGSAAAIGAILGLPIDTLHVTFVSANSAFAAAALGPDFTLSAGLYAAAGVIAIGVMNLAVSFGLALNVAMQAQQVRFNQAWPLLRRLLLHFLRAPLGFFFPPRAAETKPGPEHL